MANAMDIGKFTDILMKLEGLFDGKGKNQGLHLYVGIYRHADRRLFTGCYGYQIVDGKLIINEEEAKAIRVIYDQYVYTDMGTNGIAKYLENHGIHKIKRQNGKNPLFDAHLIRLILKKPVYCGKIAYGRRKTEKVHGMRNDYHLAYLPQKP